MQAGIGSGKRASRPLSAFALLGALALAACASLFFASLAQAGIGQLPGSEGVFGESGEQAQLGGVGATAINRSGAGGVPKGTIYVATQGPAGGTLRVAQYRPHPPGESGFDFALSWEVRNEDPYERCGPQAEEPAHKSCASQPDAIPGRIGVAVEQGSGNVFVYSSSGMGAGGLTVREYDANGKAVVARFAELAPGGVTTASTLSQVHGSPFPGGIAINDAAEVFLYDRNPFDQTFRLMRFKPKTPGDLSEYEYVAGGDIGTVATASSLLRPVIDAAGDIYTAGEGSINKFDPDKPGDPPTCTFDYKPGGITGMTVEPETGAPFFFSYKKPKLIHQLSPCNGSGEFVEEATIALSAERDDPYGLAYDPERNLSATRPLGALYAIAGASVPSSGVGKGEPGKTALGYILGGAPKVDPVVVSQAVLGAGESTAQLQGSVNPKGFQTHYAFQYLSRAAYEQAGESFSGAAEAPPGGASAGNGQSPVSVSVSLSGLLPDTEYLYRVVAESHCVSGEPLTVCHDEGEPESFATAAVGASHLPDGRAYELVSPTQKNSGQVLPADPNTKSCAAVECKPGAAYTHFPMQASPEGDAVLYEGDSFVPGEGAVIESAYLARRGATGWSSANLTPPQLLSKGGQGYKLFNASLSEGLLEQTTPSLSPEAPTAFQNLYRQPSASPTSLDPLLTNGNAFIHRLPATGLESLDLTFAGASADLSRVFFAANDALTSEVGEAGQETNLYEWREGVLTQVNLSPGEAPAPGAVFGSGRLLESGGSNIKVAVLTHAISDDGSRVFWTGADGGTYARLDGLGTLQIPGPGSCKASVTLALRTCFLTASEDGSRVLLSNGQLYELNEEAGAYEPTVDLSGGEGGFAGILGQSEDLSHLYFVDTAVLSGEEENDQGAKAQAGGFNLYAWVGGATSFVGTLAAVDNGGENDDWQAAPAARTAEASPAGRYLAFLSKAPLTGFDNVGPCKVISSTEDYEAGPCTEVFLYDSASGELSCPSCNPARAVPHGPSTLRRILLVGGSLPQPRYLTDAGRLYFDSGDALVPADSNGRAEDVYQYEPEGVGSCEREGGCVGMISGGQAATDSNLLAIDATGENVFFTTRERLVPADKDEQIDLYDARVGGGFPSVSGARAGEASGAPPPAEAIPASQGFTGPGNVAATKGCAKGKVKRKGRCVRKHAHKHQRRHRATPGRANRDRGGAK